jgi:hypothetical protein
MLHAKAHQHIKHKKLIALQSQEGDYSMILPRPEPLELHVNRQEHDDRDKRNIKSYLRRC